MDTLELRGIEDAKIHCAREHFKAISGEDVISDVADNYQALLEKVMKKNSAELNWFRTIFIYFLIAS